MLPEVEVGELAALAQQVADLWAVPIHLIFSHSRDPEHVQARWILFLALQARGYGCEQIGRATGRDHSTVLHGLNKASRRPDLLEAAGWVNRGYLPPVPPASLARYGERIAGPVYAYLRALTGQGPPDAACVIGVRLIARNPCLQQDVAAILVNRNKGHHYLRIAIHARQLGALWITYPQDGTGAGA